MSVNYNAVNEMRVLGMNHGAGEMYAKGFRHSIINTGNNDLVM